MSNLKRIERNNYKKGGCPYSSKHVRYQEYIQAKTKGSAKAKDTDADKKKEAKGKGKGKDRLGR
jgi:hypothetical protein